MPVLFFFNLGILFYGPPGTGKTTLMKLIIKMSGLTQLVEPLGSAELNRGLVGETEALLRDIFRRARFFPHLLFCIAIDEIESLVPKRESNKENSGKKDIVNQILALIEGASDIKNIYILGATNHLNKIDTAFARRMQDKFYIGYLSMEERLELIKSMGSAEFREIVFTEEIEGLIKILTINFTGAGASELKTKIKEEFLLHKQKQITGEIKANFSLNRDILSRLTNEIAKSNDIKFGGLTIADLVSSFDQSILKFWQKNLCDDILRDCTGRVNIYLTDEIRSIQFEMNRPDQDLYEFHIEDKSIHFISNFVPYLLYLTIYLKINFVKLIDSNFIKQNSEDNLGSGAASAILNFYDEYKDYSDGVVMFNGDEIVGINESGTVETGFERTKFNTSIIDQTAWTKALAHIFSKVKTPTADQTMPKKMLIFATGSKFLNDSFKASFKFPLTETERKDKKLEEDNRKMEHHCLNCERKYIEDENRVDSCSYHPNLLVNKLTDNSDFVGITKSDVLKIARDRRSEEVLKEYFYYCCVKGFDSDGCKKDKHSNSVTKINQSIKSRKVKIGWSGSHTHFRKEMDSTKWILSSGEKTIVNPDGTKNFMIACEFVEGTETLDAITLLANYRKNIFIKLDSSSAKWGYGKETTNEVYDNGHWIEEDDKDRI